MAITRRIPTCTGVSANADSCRNLILRQNRRVLGQLFCSDVRDFEKHRIQDMGTSFDVGEEQTVTRSQSVVARVVGGDTLIVPIRGKVGDLASIYSLNGTGSLIWRLLECPRTLGELVAAVSREYEVDSKLADRDVRKFICEMSSAGLVESPTAVAMQGAETSGAGETGSREN